MTSPDRVAELLRAARRCRFEANIYTGKEAWAQIEALANRARKGDAEALDALERLVERGQM